MAPILTTIPSKVMIGTTVQWTRSDSDYSSADGWVETFVAVSPSGRITIEATDYGNGAHLFAASKTASGAWIEGNYKWRIVASRNEETVPVARGNLVVEPDFLGASQSLDARTDWETILEDLMAAYKDFVSTNGARTSFSVAGRVTTFSTAEELTAAIQNARNEVNNERASERKAQGLPSGTKLMTRLL